MSNRVLSRGKIPFSIEGRILRELGERLVKQPEVALLELIKNAYDADATSCTITLDSGQGIKIEDDGVGMTLERFRDAWMRIGTSSKEGVVYTRKFKRKITGEKGIGRFAVRFLGTGLKLTTIADDPARGRTSLEVSFDWTEFDKREDLGELKVEYVLTAVDNDLAPTGTTLLVSSLRPIAQKIEWREVATGSIGVVSALRSFMPSKLQSRGSDRDPGFSLKLIGEAGKEPLELATQILDRYVLRGVLKVSRGRLHIDVFKAGTAEPYVTVDDRYVNSVGDVFADIRFFPRRPGTFAGAPVDGRAAYTWVRENSGVLVFDRGFQVRPYGMAGDDWLGLVRDAARNERHPQSGIAKKHFAMSKEVQAAPSENWMLRLPESAQLVGAVHVEGAPTTEAGDKGLVAAADREGFVMNEGYAELVDMVRGAVEAIAYADRRLQQEVDQAEAERKLQESREQTEAAIEEVENYEGLSPAQKTKIVSMLVESQQRIEQQEEGAKEREKQLEIMSLLGVIGGFMTHEFGVAITELRDAQRELNELAKTHPQFAERAVSFARHAEALEGFVAYSRAYVEGAKVRPSKPYAARPRIRQVVKVFGQYAEDRGIKVDIDVDPDVMVPLIPAALYNGIVQNLFTNALKAVTAAVDGGRVIAFRAWNDRRGHYLQVSDTGIGIPAPVRNRVFDPLFTTTDSRKDPLGSGMGLGLALVERGAAAFGGKAQLADPPPGFSTCVEIRFPLDG